MPYSPLWQRGARGDFLNKGISPITKKTLWFYQRVNALNEETDIERIINYFRDRDEVSALYLFGSSAKGKRTKESDLDIAVLIDRPVLKQKDIERFRRKYYEASPYFSLRPVDIVILNTASIFLKYQVIKTGKILFDRNRKLRVEFTERTINEYLDFKPIQDICLNAVARRFREKTVGR